MNKLLIGIIGFATVAMAVQTESTLPASVRRFVTGGRTIFGDTSPAAVESRNGKYRITTSKFSVSAPADGRRCTIWNEFRAADRTFRKNWRGDLRVGNSATAVTLARQTLAALGSPSWAVESVVVLHPISSGTLYDEMLNGSASVSLYPKPYGYGARVGNSVQVMLDRRDGTVISIEYRDGYTYDAPHVVLSQSSAIAAARNALGLDQSLQPATVVTEYGIGSTLSPEFGRQLHRERRCRVGYGISFEHSGMTLYAFIDAETGQVIDTLRSKSAKRGKRQ